jgi:predicted nucleic acid-binding protein
VNNYLLDTNVVSEFRKAKPHGAVIAWLSGLREDQLFVAAVTLGELQAGVERVRSQDREKADEIETWVDRMAESYGILPMDGPCFREWGRLMHGKPDRLAEDAMIAATARINNLVVATRNERDFRDFEVSVLNPFKSS